MIRPNGELSVIVTRLGCESVVCLEKHTQWLCRLYVLLLFYYYLRFGHLRSEGLTLGTTNFRGRSWSISGGCLYGSVAIATATRWRKRCASTYILDTFDAIFCC